MNNQQSKDFTVLKKIGEGAFSTVYSVKRNSDGTLYAMKKVKMGKLSAKEKENALNEIRILASIQHPNVIGYKEAFFENLTGNLCIVMEMADNGDLLQGIEKHKKSRSKWSEKTIWHYFVQIVHGLKALHDLKIVHRDIKCANIFLTKKGETKLGDLNVSKIAKKGLLSTQTGTPYYASPEVWKDRPYDNKSDIWSLGCVLYEMATLLPPFRAQSMQGLATKVTRGIYDPLPSTFSADLQNVVKACLQVDPKKRPSCLQILELPGLKKNISSSLSQNQEINLECQSQNLLDTIRMPRNLGQITERLPKSQYNRLQRSQSTSDVSDIKEKQLDKKSEKENVKQSNLIKLIQDQKQSTKSAQTPRVISNSKIPEQKRVLSQLPTIEEDLIDEDQHTGMLMAKKLKIAHENRQKRRDESVRKSQNYYSDKPEYIVKDRNCLPSSRQINRSDPMGLPPTNPRKQLIKIPVRSADCYSQKVARLNSQLGSRPDSDVSTRQSSQAQNYGIHDTNTPNLHKKEKMEKILPYLNHKRMQSVDLDPNFTYEYQNPMTNRSRGNRKNQCSVGLSRAMGGFNENSRYGGAAEAIRQARAISNEANRYVSQGYNQKPPSTPRGPIPQFLMAPNEQHQHQRAYQRRLDAAY